MCTVSVIPLPDGFRLACNRDELRTRPPALPPRVARFGDRSAAMPIDTAGGGTWVAVNEAGLAFALLNANARTPPLYVDGAKCFPVTRSRGLLIRELLGCKSVDDAITQSTGRRLADLAPFRLVIVERSLWTEIAWDGRRRSVRLEALDRPLLFTSSGLGDHLVQLPRHRLFADMVARDASGAAQDAFHRHSWPYQPHLSVCMSRVEARTVSYTVVEINEEQAKLRYHAAAPSEPADDAVVRLTLRLPVLT